MRIGEGDEEGVRAVPHALVVNHQAVCALRKLGNGEHAYSSQIIPFTNRSANPTCRSKRLRITTGETKPTRFGRIAIQIETVCTLDPLHVALSVANPARVRRRIEQLPHRVVHLLAVGLCNDKMREEYLCRRFLRPSDPENAAPCVFVRSKELFATSSRRVLRCPYAMKKERHSHRIEEQHSVPPK